MSWFPSLPRDQGKHETEPLGTLTSKESIVQDPGERRDACLVNFKESVLIYVKKLSRHLPVGTKTTKTSDNPVVGFIFEQATF